MTKVDSEHLFLWASMFAYLNMQINRPKESSERLTAKNFILQKITITKTYILCSLILCFNKGRPVIHRNESINDCVWVSVFCNNGLKTNNTNNYEFLSFLLLLDDFHDSWMKTLNKNLMHPLTCSCAQIVSSHMTWF